MRIPALPQTREIDSKRRSIVFRLLRQILPKKHAKKRSFVRIPPRK